MSTQTVIFEKLEECPTCRGRGFIGAVGTESVIPGTEGVSTAKLVLAFILGFLMLSPALLGLYWEVLFSRWGP